MSYLYIDLETSGLPKQRVPYEMPEYTDLNAYSTARVVSFALHIVDGSKEELPVLLTFSKLIKPEGFKIPPNMVHGITHEQATDEGLNFKHVFGKLMKVISGCNTFLAYNVDFDINVLKAEFLRREMYHVLDVFNEFKEICVMKSAYEILKLDKFEKLSVLYAKLCPELPEFKAHDALADITATLECHRKLREILRKRNTHLAK